jgi:prepilin-type N-terminal cleavage/methylation domain-containing protein
MHRRDGFTLIELLIVVVIIGILAAIAIPKFSNTRGKAKAATLKSDLRNLATAQEAYYYEWQSYSTDLTALNFRPSTGISITVAQADAAGWAASATSPQATPGTCALFQGGATPVAPATVEGLISCQ